MHINLAENTETVSIFWDYNPLNTYPVYKISYSLNGSLYTLLKSDIPNQPDYYDKYVYYSFKRSDIGIDRNTRFYIKIAGITSGGSEVDLSVKLIPEERNTVNNTVNKDTPGAGSQSWGYDASGDVWRKLRVVSSGDDDGTGLLKVRIR